MMTGCRGKKRSVLAAAIVLLLLILGGCTTIKYSYDTGTSFSGLKSYAWASPVAAYGERDVLLEVNVQTIADQLLGRKGFTKVLEKPDLLISTHYESEISYNSQYGYKIHSLTLNMYKSAQKELIWRGTASGSIGSIHTEAASGDLKQVVEKILSNFPPK